MPLCPHCGGDNPEGFRHCGFCGTVLVSSTGERRKVATLLFCDVSGSTAIGEQVDAESVRGMMTRYFQTMRSTIELHGGTVEKFVGDAVMAVFGVPISHEDDALRALRAAREMLDRVAELNAELERQFGTTLELRIGVNTGQVVAGNVSSHDTLVTGDAVNVAARLEQAAQPGDVLIGADTYRLAGNAVTACPVPPLPLKGKSGHVRAYRLLSVAPVSSPPARHRKTRLIGRAKELGFLGDAFRETTERCTCKLVTIVGEPGVGKSRLAHELIARLIGSAPAFAGRCLPYGDGITFWPVGEIVRNAAGIRDEDSREVARTRIATLLEGQDDRALIAERVAQAMGLVGGSAAIEDVTWAIRKLWEALAQAGPVVLLVDDLHWGEPVLLDFLDSLPRLSTGAPILVVCLARQELLETRPDWDATIRLQPLAETDCEELIAGLLSSGSIDAGVAGRIARTAEGNPLFVEELVAMLVDEGLLRHVDNGWESAHALGVFSIPPNLDALLGARLDRLPHDERALLERGAIEGQVFHRGAIASLSPPEEQQHLDVHLDTLVSKEFLWPTQASFAGEAAFQFRHILVRDAAYQATPKKTRTELHERFADWLEQSAAHRIREYEEILGYHLEQAYRCRADLGPLGDDARALGSRAANRLATAATKASALGDMSAAAAFFGRAASLLPEASEKRVELLPEQSRALRWIGELAGARTVAAQAVREAELTGDSRHKLHALLLELALRRLTESEDVHEELIRTAEQAIPVFERAGDEKGLLEARSILAVAAFDQGRVSNALDAWERAFVSATRVADGSRQALLGGEIALARCLGTSPVTDGINWCREALAGATGFMLLRAEILAVLSLLEAMMGSFDDARTSYEESKTIYTELGRGWELAAWVPIFSGQAELLRGDPLRAERELAASVAALEAMEATSHLSSMAPLLADALYRQGRYDEAYRQTETSEKLAASADAEAQARWRTVRAKVLTAQGECDEAEVLARLAVQIASTTEFSNLHADALMAYAEVLRCANRPREALGIAGDALQLYKRKGNAVSADHAQTFLRNALPL